MNWQDRIAIDPKVLVGKPVVKGTRLSVELVVNLMAAGWTPEQILDSYPALTLEDVRACLALLRDTPEHAQQITAEEFSNPLLGIPPS